MKYEIVGDTLPVVICHLNKGEKMISDSGAMAWMDPCMKMETNGGGAGKIVVQTMPISAVANSLAKFFPQGK